MNFFLLLGLFLFLGCVTEQPVDLRPEEEELTPIEPQVIAAPVLEEDFSVVQESESFYSLFSVMSSIGFTRTSEIEAAELVYAPPASRIEAGSFGNGEIEVQVVLIEYPNSRYAAPHFHDVQERIAVIPDLGESVLWNEATVFHFRTVDRQMAVIVRDLLATHLQWEDD